MMNLSKLIYLFVLMLACVNAIAEPAVVIDDFGCGGFVPDGGGESLADLYTTESHKVITKKGIRILTCHFEHEVPLDHAIGAQGFLCGVSGGTVDEVTTDTTMLATPAGRATLVCKINGTSDGFHAHK